MSALVDLVLGKRALVCVGTGGVGKTTVAAALGLLAAKHGRRTMVLTIDPARQLARALGLTTLGRVGEPVDTQGHAAAGLLHAGMLDLKASWDAFIDRHAPSAQARDAMLANPFYQRLSTSFAGATEFMAIEELCRLDESRAYELLIIDTPPAGRAVDFLQAPARLEQLLAPEVAQWIVGKKGGRGALGAMAAGARLLLGQLERALGTRTLGEVGAFFALLEAMFGDLGARAASGRALLTGPDTGFVLVAAPTAVDLAGAQELVVALRQLGAPLAGVIANRVHPLPGPQVTSDAEASRVVRRWTGEPSTAAWLDRAWGDARMVAALERERLAAFRAGLAAPAWREVPELPRDAHSLEDLAALSLLLDEG